MMDIRKTLLPIVASCTIIAGGVAHQVTERQYDFTSGWEGVAYVPYADIASPTLLTVCRGITNYAAPGWVVKDKVYTQEECFNKEVELMEKMSRQIAPLIKTPMTQQQREMVGDFVWNCGLGNFKSSTLLKRINNNQCTLAANEFDKWVKSGGKYYKGLASRRNAEEDNFRKWCLPSGEFPKE